MSRTNGDYSTVYVVGLLEVDSDASGVTDARTFYGFAGVQVTVRAHDGVDTTFVTQNHLGSAVAAFNDDTDSLALTRYHPWGTERLSGGSLPSDHRFTNQIADDTSASSGGADLYFYNARYYDPSLGVFAAADTIGQDLTPAADINRYRYARANPQLYTDESGHLPTVCADRERCFGPGMGDPGLSTVARRAHLAEAAVDRYKDLWSEEVEDRPFVWWLETLVDFVADNPVTDSIEEAVQWAIDHPGWTTFIVATAMCLGDPTRASCARLLYVSSAVSGTEYVIDNGFTTKNLLVGILIWGVGSGLTYFSRALSAPRIAEWFAWGGNAGSRSFSDLAVEAVAVLLGYDGRVLGGLVSNMLPELIEYSESR